ncbi:MAG: 30S ribosomal protein S21 [Cyanobium sp. MAG06]|nr:30S ribosomal protein S21 [Cyanobium sp. MAG06]
MTNTTTTKISKKPNENAASIIRRFQKRVQESGVLMKARSKRAAERPLSKLKTKLAKLKKIENTEKYMLARRMGIAIKKK